MVPRGTSVTLVEPRYPVNLGHVARLVSNFGVQKLYLVRPKVDMSTAAVYASHASNILDTATLATFKKVREENELLVATTAIKASKRSNVIRAGVGPEELRPLLSSSRTSSIVFGRDSTGLTNEEIRACDVTVTIDTAKDYRSLNIGHAVAILLYAASRPGSVRMHAQSRVAREVFAKTLSELGVAARVPEHHAGNLFEVAKRIAAGSDLTDRQLNLMSGIFTKARERIGIDS